MIMTQTEFVGLLLTCVVRVEFQNKFYAGDGRKFKPFAYSIILNPKED